MRIALLGSGSRGNSVLIETGDTSILVDAGFSARELVRRLDLLGRDPRDIAAIVVTHEHVDHTRGIGVFARRFETPIHMTDRTKASCSRLFRGEETILPYRAGYPFEIGGLRIEPFLTAHDAVEPIAVCVTARASDLRVGVATDLGRPTAGVRHALSGCHFLVLEANHDDLLLRESRYPWSVKERISSSHGHLSNAMAASLASELLHPDLAGIALAHLSEECNDPDRALHEVREALVPLGYAGLLAVAGQEDPTPLWDLPALLDRLRPSQLSLL